MTRIWPLLCLPVLAAAAPPPDPLTVADVRCVVVVGGLIDSTDPDVKRQTALALLYYLGRVDGRSPGLDMKTLYEAEAKKMTPDDRKSLLRSCMGQVEKRLSVGS